MSRFFLRITPLLITVLTLGSLAQAKTIYSNIGRTPDGSDHAGVFGPLYDSFSTGITGGVLEDLKLLLSTDDPNSSGVVRIVLFADNSGEPGARITRLAKLRESTLTLDPEIYDINLRNNPLLEPNTRYWIGLRSGPNTLWAWSSDVRGAGVIGEYFSNSEGTFDNDTFGPYQMSVSITTAVPETDSLILLISASALIGSVLSVLQNNSKSHHRRARWRDRNGNT